MSQDFGSDDESYGYDYPGDSGMFLDGTYQVIKWTTHQPTRWVSLIDENGREMWVVGICTIIYVPYFAINYYFIILFITFYDR